MAIISIPRPSARTLMASLLVVAIFSTAAADLQVPEELKTPAQPAFTLLGVTPTSIDRPSTPRAFAVGLLGAFADSKDSLPRNLALEVAPYWWSSRPSETYDSLNSRTK